MVARSRRKQREPSGGTADRATQAVRESAQKIWLAGLGAFERAKSEGPRMFESLVEQGRNMGARAVGVADEALKSMREADFAGGRWDKLEQVFEERVSRSLKRLGVITSREVEELSRQVQELNESVRGLMREGARASAGKRAAAGARRPAARAKGKRKASRASRARPA